MSWLAHIGRHARAAVLFIFVAMFALPVQAQQAPNPDADLAVILIRDALTALNQANWTGNYTVFRDYASPNFARVNDPVRLTAIFQPIRAQRLNLAPALVIVPKITRAELNNNRTRLRLTGFFPSKPKQIHFDLVFEPIVTRWLLFGISVWSTDAVAEPNVVNNQSGSENPATGDSNANNIPIPQKRPESN